MSKNMKRVEIQLDEVVWANLKIRARQRETSVSGLLRGAVTERFAPYSANREQAMRAFVGIWKSRKRFPGSRPYVRCLRERKHRD